MLQLVIFSQMELLPRIKRIRNFLDRISLKYILNPLDEYETGKQLINQTIGDEIAWENISFKLSARNQLPGKALGVEKDGLVCRIKIEIEPSVITSVITRKLWKSWI